MGIEPNCQRLFCYRVESKRDVEVVDEFAIVILDNREGYLTLIIVTYQ